MELVRTLKALADTTRLRVLAAVAEQELTVGEIQEVVNSLQSTVSRHLAILREAGLVQDRREGTNVYFSMRQDMPAQAKELYHALAPRLADLPEAKQDQARLQECRRRRVQRSRNYFESIAGDWERIRKSYFDDRVTSLAIEKLVPANLVLVDVGCGTGSLALELARLAKKVIAIDLSREMIRHAGRRAKERGVANVEFRLGAAEKLPLADNSVDGAFCVMVLHFLENPARAITETCRVVRSGGSVILVDLVPHTQGWMREEMAHRWLGFERRTVEKWLRGGGAGRVEYELTGAYAGGKMSKDGKRPVEIFVARAALPEKTNRRHAAKK